MAIINPTDKMKLERNVGRIKNLKAAIATASTQERKAQLQSELDERTKILTDMQSQIKEALE